MTQPIGPNGPVVLDSTAFDAPLLATAMDYAMLGSDAGRGDRVKAVLDKISKGLPYYAFDFTGGVLPPGASVARASAGTYVGSNGLIASAAAGVARFDYNAKTLAKRGLLLERASSNVLDRSQEMDSASFSPLNATVTANDRAAPDGTMTADRIDFQSSGRLWRAGPGAGQQVGSIFAYSATAQPITFGFYDGDVFTGTFNLPANDWMRIQFPRNFVSSDRRMWILEKGVAYTIWTWGWQCEAGTEATSYMPTTTGPTNRAADVLTLNWSGIGLADGTYVLRYFFEDGTFQSVVTTITGSISTISGADLQQRRIMGVLPRAA